MTRSRVARSLSAFGLATAVVGGVLVHGMAASSAAATPPPWDPDPSAVGTITFYDSTGAVMTSGSLTDSPFYTYAVGTSTAADGDYSNAKVELSQPDAGKTPSQFNSDYMGASTADPISASGTPANIVALSATHPVSASKPTDLSISFFESEYPAPSSPASYANLYQVRLVTDNGASNSLKYDEAAILVDDADGTWTQVYPSSQIAPATPTNVKAVKGDASAKVSWTEPTSSGGATPTGYNIQYSSDDGTTWKSASASFNTKTATTETVTGLTNGKSYVFRVQALSGAGSSQYSAPSNAVTPTADTSSLTIGHTSATIAYGKSVTITTHLTDLTTKKSLSGKSVQLLAKPAGSSKFTQVKKPDTNSSGNASATLKPTRNTQYEWHYAGSATNKAATSKIEKVTVKQTLTIASKGTAKPNTAFKVYGMAKPAGSGQKATLQVKSGSSWKNVSTVTIHSQKLPTGKTAVSYVFSVKEKKKGSYTFRVTKAATATNGAGTSGTIAKKVS